jgi:hypothetical protein
LITTIALLYDTTIIKCKCSKIPDLDKSPMDVASYPTDYKNADKLAKVTYSRPQLKDVV